MSSQKDSQLAKEIDGAVNDIHFCCKFWTDGRAAELLHQVMDSLCLWEEGGLRMLGKWSPRLVAIVSMLRREDRLRMDSSMSSRSCKMKRLSAQNMFAKLPRTKAAILLLLDGDPIDGDTLSGNQQGVMGRSKRRRVAKVRE